MQIPPVITSKCEGSNMMRSQRARYITYAVLAFLYLPVVILIISSFNASTLSTSWGNWTFHWYRRLFFEPSIWHALINSLTVAVYSSITASAIGLTAALASHRYRSYLQKINLYVLIAPLIMPDILMGICLLFLFVSLSVKLSLMTVFLAHTTFSTSYVAMIMRTRLETLDKSIIEAARDLGATSWQIFWKVLLPFLAPALIGGALFAFTLSLDDFVITYFVVGPGATTLPVYVYSMIKFGAPPLINALSTLILIATAIIITAYYRLTEEVRP
jgi:spermidine/putrescine transport system permease protein